ncbi:MAG: class D sortase [Oscillospiraceae bacterium]|nr:class D sortase [Oscillospiraceae bacterium]
MQEEERTQQPDPAAPPRRHWGMFIAGLLAMLIGLGILGFYGGRKLYREYRKHRLCLENAVIAIPELRIRAPVMEGTEQSVLSQAAGHFPGTGDTGSGNYCIAAHSSILYKEYFNRLKDAQEGTQIELYDVEKHCYHYTVSQTMIVEPNEVWVLGDFGDDRITLITCTDDGSQRLVVVGMLDRE